MNAVNAHHLVSNAVHLAHQVWMAVHQDEPAQLFLESNGRLVRSFHENLVAAVEAFEPVEQRFRRAIRGPAQLGRIVRKSWHNLALAYARLMLWAVLMKMDEQSYKREEVDPSVVAENWLTGSASLLATSDFPRLDRYCRDSILEGVEEEISWVDRTTKRTGRKKPTPENLDVAKLAKKIKRDSKSGEHTTQIAVAREFTKGDEKRAQSLLRQLRRFPHLPRG